MPLDHRGRPWLDVVHRDLGFGDVETGGGKLYRPNIAESQIVPEDYYMRIGIRGSDAWRPSVVTACGQRFTSGAIVPLGYDEELDVVRGLTGVLLHEAALLGQRTGEMHLALSSIPDDPEFAPV